MSKKQPEPPPAAVSPPALVVHTGSRIDVRLDTVVGREIVQAPPFSLTVSRWDENSLSEIRALIETERLAREAALNE